MIKILYFCISSATESAGIVPAGSQLCSMWEKTVQTPQVWSEILQTFHQLGLVNPKPKESNKKVYLEHLQFLVKCLWWIQAQDIFDILLNNKSTPVIPTCDMF